MEEDERYSEASLGEEEVYFEPNEPQFIDIKYHKTTSSNIRLEGLLNGKVSALFSCELAHVLLNIADLNNLANAERTISVVMGIKPNENRDIAEVKVSVSSSCNSHSKPLITSFLIGETARTIEAVERYSPPRDGEGNPFEEPIEPPDSVACNITLENLFNGAVSETFDHVLSEVLMNIADVNNQALAVRKISIKTAIKPSETRDYATITVKVTSSSNGQTRPILTGMMIQRRADLVIATERATPEQMSLFN